MATDDAPAICLLNYMGDLDDLNETNLIGPFDSEVARDAEWKRLDGLPDGGREFNGGVRFAYATMAEQVPSARVVAPGRVAKADSVKAVFDAFFGWED